MPRQPMTEETLETTRHVIAVFREGSRFPQYVYSDHIPRYISCISVFMVICFIIATPVSLICSIAALRWIVKVHLNKCCVCLTAHDVCIRFSMYGSLLPLTLLCALLITPFVFLQVKQDIAKGKIRRAKKDFQRFLMWCIMLMVWTCVFLGIGLSVLIAVIIRLAQNYKSQFYC